MLVTVVGLLGAAAGLGWFIKVTVNDQFDRLRNQQRCNYTYLAERLNDVIDRRVPKSSLTTVGPVPFLPLSPIASPTVLAMIDMGIHLSSL